MPKSRGRYKLYTADKSVDVPKVSLWRMRRLTCRKGQKILPGSQEESEDMRDSQLITDEIDYFHEEAINSVIPDPNDDPALIETTRNETVSDEEMEEDEDDKDDHPAVEPSEADKPLYPGAKVTLAASMILLISFAMRHSLTGQAVADLLILLEVHCLTPNLCQRNLKTFKSFFCKFTSPLEFHHYCEKCFLHHGTVRLNNCPNCKTTTRKNSTAYFLVIPIISQLMSLFADGRLIQQIWTQKATMQSTPDEIITDVSDGQLYKERFGKDGYFLGSTAEDHGQLHISLQMNTDGVSLFRSSNFSIWPVYFIINELPPHIRFSRNNRIFAGLWFGYSKPDFSTFLKPFAQSLHEIYNTGFRVENLTVRGILLNAVFDAPARCLFQNMVQFNGYYGCPYCEAPGKTVQTSVRGHTLSYPFNTENPHGYHSLRTHASMTRNAEISEQSKQNSNNSSPILGVKGLSWFHYLPQFDIVRGVAIDYMHCVLLGVMKMLMVLWFDKTHRNEIYSISSKVSEVDQRLLSIRPPNFITRLPRSISEISHFKAAELKNFLLFYSLPCLFGLLPEEQFHHFSLLVFSVYILLQDTITRQDIQYCKKNILEFVLNIPVLYGERYSTSNVHLLLHMTDKVEDLGPLWCSSCFYFEDFNGQIRRLFHGTQNIETQIAFAVCIHQNLPKLSECLEYGSSESELYKHMMEKNLQRTREEIADKISVVGAYHTRQLTPEENFIIYTAVGNFHSVSIFKRVHINKQIIHSTNYKSATRRNNTIVKYNGTFGQIQNFFRVSFKCTPQCSENCCKPAFLAVVNEMIRVDDRQGYSERHMVKLRPPRSQEHLRAVPVKEITDVCISVQAKGDLCFVSAIPNRIEKE